MAVQVLSMQSTQFLPEAALISRRESSFLAGSSSVTTAKLPCKSPRYRKRQLKVAGAAASVDSVHSAPVQTNKNSRSGKPPSAPAPVATRRRALFGYSAVLALGHVTAAAAANPAGTKLVAQTAVRNEALHTVKQLQKAGARSFNGLRNGLAAVGSRSFKEVQSLAKAGSDNLRELRRTVSRASSRKYSELVANLDHAGAAMKSNVEGTVHKVEEGVRDRVHDVVGKLGDVAEGLEGFQMECADKAEDAKAQAINDLADLIEDTGDAVKFLRWASEMYQTVSATK